MDFFDQQHRAKRVSALLLLLFFVVTTFFILIFAYLGGLLGGGAGAVGGSVTVLLIILFGSVSEWRRLANGGGHAIAQRVGAKRLFINKSSDALNTGISEPSETTQSTVESLSRDEKKLLNAVENMSIASSMRMPATFVMPNERGINAFVAGFKEHDMVLVTTQGAIEQLSEEELYGLIGHEFSHIAHGDTRINLRLLIMIGGLQLLYEIASNMLYDDDDWDNSWRRSSSVLTSANKRSDGVNGIIAMGWLVLIISSIGVFCARLIKYAVSRQREYLADAASVQYTRSNGVLNTLVKVRNSKLRGSIHHPSAESISHFFFAKAMSPASWFGGLLSTHPPIDKRIQRLDAAVHRRLQVQDSIREKAEIRRLHEEIANSPEHEQKDAHKYRQPSGYDGTPVEFVTSGFTEMQQMSEESSQQQVAPTQPDSLKRSSAALNEQEAHTTAKTLPIRNRELAQHYASPTESYIPPFTVDQALESGTRGRLAVIAAALACHQQTHIEPEDYEVSRLLFDTINADMRQHDIPLIRMALKALNKADMPPKAISLYLQRLYRIITIDNHVSVLEQLLLDQISHAFGYLTNIVPSKTLVSVADAFGQIVDAVLVADGQSQQDIIHIKQRMLRLAGFQSTQQQATFHQVVNLGQSLSVLAKQDSVLKKTLVDTLETAMMANGEISLDEQHVLSLLNWRLHVVL